MRQHWFYARHPGFASHDGIGHIEQTAGRIELPPWLHGIEITARLQRSNQIETA